MTHLIFVDSNGWLAYLDERHPKHAMAVKLITTNENVIFTSDDELLELSLHAKQIDQKKIGALIWDLFEGKLGKVLKVTTQDDQKAWEHFEYVQNKSIKYSYFTSSIIIKKNKFSTSLQLTERI